MGGVDSKEVAEWQQQYQIPADRVEQVLEGFQNSCGKEGQITQEKFVATMSRLMGNAEKAKATFDAFDVDGSGSIDVHEYLSLMGAVYGNNMDQKLEASFKLFDENKDGQLSREELEHMLTRTICVWLSQRAKKRVTVLPAEYKAKIDTTLDEIFKTIDTDGNGFLDKDEFKKGFAEHPEVCSFFKQF